LSGTVTIGFQLWHTPGGNPVTSTLYLDEVSLGRTMGDRTRDICRWCGSGTDSSERLIPGFGHLLQPLELVHILGAKQIGIDGVVVQQGVSAGRERTIAVGCARDRGKEVSSACIPRPRTKRRLSSIRQLLAGQGSQQVAPQIGRPKAGRFQVSYGRLKSLWW